VFDKTQLTITNSSNKQRLISLWGMNKANTVSPPLLTDVEDHKINYTLAYSDFINDSGASLATHPQGIAVNPANGLTYVANQLSNNVSVIDIAGQLVQLVELQASVLGFNSPVAVAVNTNSSSVHYGKVYVAGSVTDTVSVIDLSLNVTNTIATGVRPVDLAFNPVNNQLYVVNLFSDNLTVIDTDTENVSTTLGVGTDPLGVGIHPINGEIYVANSSDNTVSIWDAANNLINTLAAVGTTPVSVTYHPVNDEMYVVCSQSNELFPIEGSTHNLLPSIATGNSPYKSIFNPANNFLYVGNRADDTFTVIAPDKTLRATISKGNVNIGMAINTATSQLVIADTATDSVNLMGYADQSSNISINEDYKYKSQDFLYHPGIVKHTKWVLSGTERFKVLNHIEETPTGIKKTTPISHENYRHPQNFLNVSEMIDLEGTIIDGKNTWQFNIAPNQTITLLVYFRQFRTEPCSEIIKKNHLG
jgi:YVTN family beta-propeller protein|tara:strand:- start:35873 stop:37300 length:1428 start_codon:yes stop_codon:yes gene_type:complete